MKKIILFAMTLSLVSFAEAGRNNNREHRQEARIAQGVKSGELNRHEAKRLARGQKKIDHFQKKAMEDGELSAKEKAKLEKMQDRQNKRIYKQKHDDQQRGDQQQVTPEQQPSAPIENNTTGE